MKSIFSGLKGVFSFTYMQSAKKKKFYVSTIVVALILFAGAIVANFAMASSQKKKSEVETNYQNIEKVYVINNSDLRSLYVDQLPLVYKDKYPKLKIVPDYGTKEEVIKAVNAKNNGYNLLMVVTNTQDSVDVEMIIPEKSVLSEDDVRTLYDDMVQFIQVGKLYSSGVPNEKIQEAIATIEERVEKAGNLADEESTEIVRMLVSMFVALVLYILCLLYGITVGNTVSVEKTSKLMEMLLTLTKPYGIIGGKVGASVALALTQFFSWVLSFVLGFVIGDKLAASMVYSEFDNDVFKLLSVLRELSGGFAFSAASVIMFIVIVVLAFLFFCSIAGLCASFASTPEELGQVMGFFQLSVVVGFFGGYMAPLAGNDTLNTILRFVPVTAAFMLPADALSGAIKFGPALGYTALMFAFTVLVVVLTGKIYKDQLFKRGKK